MVILRAPFQRLFYPTSQENEDLIISLHVVAPRDMSRRFWDLVARWHINSTPTLVTLPRPAPDTASTTTSKMSAYTVAVTRAPAAVAAGGDRAKHSVRSSRVLHSFP